jgi:ABC-type sugar transport system substrate-binding protein
MTHYPSIRKTRQSGAGALALFGAFATLCLGISMSAGDIKVVGTTLLSLKYPFLVSLGDAMKTEAAKQGIDLRCLDPQQGVATELSQIKDLITKKVDLIVMIPVDQKTSQNAAKLIPSVSQATTSCCALPIISSSQGQSAAVAPVGQDYHA